MATGRSAPTKLPWWDADATGMQFQRRIASALQHLQSLRGPARWAMEARAFVTTVMVSCDIENVPVRIATPEEIFRHLTSIYEDILRLCPPNQPLKPFHRRIFHSFSHDWSWQLSSSAQSSNLALLSQLNQHLKALMFLCIYHRNEPLDVSLLKQTHFILMQGYREDTCRPYMHGSGFRDTPLHSDGAVFIHESAVCLNLKDMLCRLHGSEEDENPISVHTGDDDSFPYQSPPLRSCLYFPERCATLLHDMTHIQPFMVGQEWMCRLIMAHYMVSHEGFAFPVPIAPITHRTSEEFLHALSAPDDDSLKLHEDFVHGFRREKALLSAYILECVCESLEEFTNA